MFRIGSFKSALAGLKKYAFTSCDADEEDDFESTPSIIEQVCKRLRQWLPIAEAYWSLIVYFVPLRLMLHWRMRRRKWRHPSNMKTWGTVYKQDQSAHTMVSDLLYRNKWTSTQLSPTCKNLRLISYLVATFLIFSTHSFYLVTGWVPLLCHSLCINIDWSCLLTTIKWLTSRLIWISILKERSSTPWHRTWLWSLALW